VPDVLPPELRRHRIATTFIGRLPGAARLYKGYLPLMPMALENLDLREYDLVISSESGPAKNVITRPDAVHVCYCHSPMRYLWDMAPEYRAGMSLPARILFAPVAHYLRLVDVAGARRVDAFAANSAFVAQRIRKYYRREAQVVHPPVDTDFFTPGEHPRKSHYLTAGQLVGYKRVDLAVAACTELNLPLIVAGEGPEEVKLKRMSGPSVRFVGRVSDDDLRELMRSCRALIFPGVEDFGLVPVEAMACGAPVVAFAAGGALETVLPNRTGIFFREQSVESLKDALMLLENGEHDFDQVVLRRHAESFGRNAFFQGMTTFLHTQGVYP
jgi:glycosyltransferase involved in cell wall biosynthesis